MEPFPCSFPFTALVAGKTTLEDGLVFHHVGCLVDSLERTLETYKGIYSSSSPPIDVPSQGIRVAFMHVSGLFFVEFIESLGASSKIHNLRKKGANYYHLGMLTPNWGSQWKRFEKNGFRVIVEFESPAFPMMMCRFLISPQMELLEIISKD